jgi:hypothetical protein
VGGGEILDGGADGLGPPCLLTLVLARLEIDDPVRLDAWYAIIAIAAGFSERMIPGMLGIAS